MTQNEAFVSRGKIILDGGWVFYSIKRRYYGKIDEQEADGWVCQSTDDLLHLQVRS